MNRRNIKESMLPAVMKRGEDKILHVILSRRDRVKMRVRREYNKFRYEMARLKKDEIIEECHKIYFYTCVREYFDYNDGISEDVYDFLFKHDGIISHMWEIYLKYEELECGTWEYLDMVIFFWMNEI